MVISREDKKRRGDSPFCLFAGCFITIWKRFERFYGVFFYFENVHRRKIVLFFDFTVNCEEFCKRTVWTDKPIPDFTVYYKRI